MAFESITDVKIDELLRMPKRVSNPATRAKDKEGHRQLNYKVRATQNADYEFTLYTRQNLRLGMEDDFSCGLSWTSPNGEVLTLVRYNGSNHPHPNHLEGTRIEFENHIHQATERYIRANRKPDGFAERSDKYKTLMGALSCLLDDCNIVGISVSPEETLLFE